MTIIYQDERVICDRESITIKHYYQPLGGDKKIFYRDINTIKIKKINPFSGLSQIWGKANNMLAGNTAGKLYWASLDFKRIFKNKAIIINEGNLVKSVITPEDVDTVFEILQTKIS